MGGLKREILYLVFFMALGVGLALGIVGAGRVVQDWNGTTENRMTTTTRPLWPDVGVLGARIDEGD